MVDDVSSDRGIRYGSDLDDADVFLSRRKKSGIENLTPGPIRKKVTFPREKVFFFWRKKILRTCAAFARQGHLLAGSVLVGETKRTYW